MADIVIYGGTFNPIHNGHISICRYVLHKLHFDKILLIPSAAPPHKDAPELACSADRLHMCKLAAEELADIEVLDWELLRGGLSYTIDTINYLSQQLSGNNLFLLMGSDMFLTFRQWRDWQGIGKRATLLVASRETDDKQLLEQQQKSLETDGVVSRILENPVTPLSSTEIRDLLPDGKGFELLPQKVASYIREQGMYGCGFNLAELRDTVKPLMKPERYHHTICVEKQAVHLAKLYGEDVNKAAAAGILHDICKNMPNDALLQRLKNSGTMYNVDFEAHPQLMHGHAGALYIRDVVGITDGDIINAVAYHTTARAGMSLLERIIYIADLTSEERDYTEVDKLRKLADNSLEEAMLSSLTHMLTEYLPSLKIDICKDTEEAFEQYQNIINNHTQTINNKTEERK